MRGSRAPDDPGFVARRLADFGSGIYASRSYIARHGHPRTPAELAGHERVGYAPELAHAPEERWLVEHATGARVAVRVGSPNAYRVAIQEGIGVGIYECHSADRAGLVRLWDEPVLMEQWWAVVHVDVARAARIRAVLQFLSDLAESNRDRLAGRRQGDDAAPRRGVRNSPRSRATRRRDEVATPAGSP